MAYLREVIVTAAFLLVYVSTYPQTTEFTSAHLRTSVNPSYDFEFKLFDTARNERKEQSHAYSQKSIPLFIVSPLSVDRSYRSRRKDHQSYQGLSSSDRRN